MALGVYFPVPHLAVWADIWPAGPTALPSRESNEQKRSNRRIHVYGLGGFGCRQLSYL